MKKRKPQSQRKIIPKSIVQGNILKRNKTNLISTFRHSKDNKLLSNQQIKKDLNKSNKDSPRTIDYIQVMNKYSHLMEQNPESTNKNKEQNIFHNNNYYIKTDYNQDKNKNMINTLPYNNINNTNMVNINENDNFFQFCRTDYDYENNEKEENKNNFKYYTLKNFYLKKKSSSAIYNNFNNNNIYNKNDIKNKNREIEENKINNILMSYNRNIKQKNRENIFFDKNKNLNLYNQKNNNLHNNKINRNNIHNNLALKKIYKKNNSLNGRSLNNIANNRTNKYFNDKNNHFKNFFSSYDINNQNNKSEEINQKFFNYNYFSEKIISFINLCQKYANILNNCIGCIELNQNSICNNNDYIEELKYYIYQYNKFIFNEKINKFFNINNNFNNLKTEGNNNNIYNFNLSEFEPKTFNLTEKFRNKINDLKTEKSEINNELILYKKKNKTLILEKEELNIVINKIKKENEDLNNKIKNYMNLENKCYHQTNMIDKLKCQIETLNIDIKYKENIINNLQKILEQIKIKSNLVNNINQNTNTNDSDKIKINISKNNNNHTLCNKKSSLKDLGNEYIIKGLNNVSDFLLDVNSESIEKDIILPLNLKVNSIEGTIDIKEDNKKKSENDSEIIINNKEESQKNILKLKQNLNSKNNINNTNFKSKLFFSDIEEPEILTKEMEKIDQDILNLKSKLKKIISK